MLTCVCDTSSPTVVILANNVKIKILLRVSKFQQTHIMETLSGDSKSCKWQTVQIWLTYRKILFLKSFYRSTCLSYLAVTNYVHLFNHVLYLDLETLSHVRKRSSPPGEHTCKVFFSKSSYACQTEQTIKSSDFDLDLCTLSLVLQLFSIPT